MNRNQKLCIASLFFSYYIISKIFPFRIAAFSKGGLMLGLVFPFIEKRLRVLITLVYQGISGFLMVGLLRSGGPTVFALLDWGFKDSVDPITSSLSDGVISSSEYVLLFFLARYPQILGVIKILTGVFLAVSFLSLIVSGLNLIGSFTEPYSCYWLYKKLGLFNLIEKHTGGRIVIDDR